MKVEQSRVSVLKYLIYNLDERGYLTEEPEEIAGILGEEPGKVREAIEILHSMEPLGVGAKICRNVSCSSFAESRIPSLKRK